MFEARVDFPTAPRFRFSHAAARTLTSASNRLMLDVAEEALV